MFFLFVALKIPIAMLAGIIWWAVRSVPDPDEGTGGDGGIRRRPHGPPKLPRRPRRGPHGDPAPASPPRVRSVTARARTPHR